MAAKSLLRLLDVPALARRCFVLHRTDDKSASLAKSAAGFLEQRFGIKTQVADTSYSPSESSNGANDILDDTSFAMCFGGDGTLLHMSRIFQNRCPPVLSICTGSVGFMMGNGPENLLQTLERVVTSEQNILHMMRLKCDVINRNADGSFTREEHHALNDFVIHRSQHGQKITLDCEINGHHLTTIDFNNFDSNGLHCVRSVCIRPDCPPPCGFHAPCSNRSALTLISPHPFAQGDIAPIEGDNRYDIHRSRTLLFSKDIIMVSPQCRASPCWAVDGRINHHLGPQSEIEITQSPHSLPMIVSSDMTETWVAQLHNFLHWNSSIKRPT